MHALDDIARFESGAPAPVVSASFACPLCLHRPVRVLIAENEGGCQCGCECTACDVRWQVHLTSEQFLRLALYPPADVPIQVASRVPRG